MCAIARGFDGLKMLEALRKAVCQANVKLVEEGLVVQTWGNASGIDRARGLVVIKPSGVSYSGMTPAHMVVVALDTGKVVEGKLKPSSDTATHLELYRAFAGVGGIVHTHSLHATAWAQACRAIPAFGTTHADYFHGEVPCTRALKPREIDGDYELNTGRLIVERFKAMDPMRHPAVLVASHGPFAWGADVLEAAHNAAVLEFVARLAAETLSLNARIEPIPPALLDKHFLRKHGPGAYYGQNQKSGSV
jgi:L-ribulose-5-phosphate 4-epimerase